jgi:hypothetical protein
MDTVGQVGIRIALSFSGIRVAGGEYEQPPLVIVGPGRKPIDRGRPR